MDYPVDVQLFRELASKDIADVVFPPFCEYSDKEYRVKAWNGVYSVNPHSREIRAVEGTREAHDYFYVFLINYLLSARIEKSTNEWISEKDLVGGVTFFRGPHEIPTKLISDTFGDDLEALKQKCDRLGGKPLDMADCSYSFDVVGSLRVALLYWVGDEDFPAEAKILVDSSVADVLKLDVVYALLCDTCFRIAQ